MKRKQISWVAVVVWGALLVSYGCRKDTNEIETRSLAGTWQIDKVEWEKVIPALDITQSGINDTRDSVIFRSNGTGEKHFVLGHGNSYAFTYYVTGDTLYVTELSDVNAYTIIHLDRCNLVLNLVKKNVDWDNDGTPENLNNSFYYSRVK